MKKILFLIHKTSDISYKDCVESIKALKKHPLYKIEFATWSNDSGKYTTSDMYIEAYNYHKQDITIIIEDTVLFVDENAIRKIVDIFSADSKIGLIGIKGVDHFPDNSNMDEADIIYGGCYEMVANRDVYEKKYTNITEPYVQVETVSSTMLAVRGYINVWSRINHRIIGEVLSVAVAMYGYKVVVPKCDICWCLTTLTEPVFTAEDVTILQNKYKLKRILFQTDHYLLTIGIPTYNRSKYFRKCIANLYSHIGDMPWIEVFVSNNDSTDDTEEIALQYLKYNNFRYYKQPVNIVGKNFNYLYENASGDYVVACGDDDYYSAETILKLLEVICLYPNSTLIELCWQETDNKKDIIHNSGINNFVVDCTNLYTCISSVVLHQQRYLEIESKDNFSDTHLNQCYVQLEMIRKNPEYVVLSGYNFLSESGECASGRKFSRGDRIPFCDIFIREYYLILDYFLDKGLNKEAYEKEKILNLQKVLSWLYEIKALEDNIQWLIDDDLPELMEEFYGYEPYYHEVRAHVTKLLS